MFNALYPEKVSRFSQLLSIRHFFSCIRLVKKSGYWYLPESVHSSYSKLNCLTVHECMKDCNLLKKINSQFWRLSIRILWDTVSGNFIWTVNNAAVHHGPDICYFCVIVNFVLNLCLGQSVAPDCFSQLFRCYYSPTPLTRAKTADMLLADQNN